jgi:hypothetical protein
LGTIDDGDLPSARPREREREIPPAPGTIDGDSEEREGD